MVLKRVYSTEVIWRICIRFIYCIGHVFVNSGSFKNSFILTPKQLQIINYRRKQFSEINFSIFSKLNWHKLWSVGTEQVLVYISLLWRPLRGAGRVSLDAVPRCRLRLRQRAAGVVSLPLRHRVVRPALRERGPVRRPALSSRWDLRHRRPACSFVIRPIIGDVSPGHFDTGYYSN